MREQLKILEELQHCDARIQALEAELKAIPQQLKLLRDDIDRIQGVLDKEKVQLGANEGLRGDKEAQLRLEEQQLSKAKVKAQAVKSPKEYMALQREVEASKKLIGDREEEILKLGELVDQFRQTVGAHESDVTGLLENFKERESTGRERSALLEVELASVNAERKRVAAKMSPELLKRYSAIRMRRGLAVVAVHEGTCQGCNMTIPPQLYNILRRLENLEVCPSCHRIIYWDKILEDTNLERGEARSA